MTIRRGKVVKKRAYKMNIAHPLDKNLVELSGFSPYIRNRKKHSHSGCEEVYILMMTRKLLMRQC